MKRWNILILGIIGVLAISFVIAKRRSASMRGPEKESASTPTVENKRSPVLVELFTSEGCSSCPPADDLLARLEKEQPIPGAEIIVLSQHVDYWNSLGWADPYSSATFSERQGQYAEAFNRDGVYTPQMVVDGHEEFVGSNWDKAQSAIASATKSAKARIQITRGESSENKKAIPLSVRIDNLPTMSADENADVLLAVTESDLHSSVARGENAGRKLNHTAVVRQLSVIGNVNSQSGKTFLAAPVINVAKDWRHQNLRAVIFVQEHGTRRVLGVASLDLAAK